jgi:hypothetical protein
MKIKIVHRRDTEHVQEECFQLRLSHLEPL